ncbi:hypothetical protein ACI703_15105 [Isoptericola jiangsuensis]|uniref:hypothetical protein n=1 Tax=Isoptericola jiangsuensis TaxID=548579 RepID=UPI00386F6F52
MAVSQTVLPPFYTGLEFWIGFSVGLAGLVFSVLAFIEARKAKEAASEAGEIVKIQTVAIELTEVAQKLDKLDAQLTFVQARDSLNEISRRLRRLIAPFQDHDEFEPVCSTLKTTLSSAKEALDNLISQDGLMTELPPNSVYFATQSHLAGISGNVAELIGLIEKKTMVN